jgi:capsular polysaccharide biosynthesis protein
VSATEAPPTAPADQRPADDQRVTTAEALRRYPIVVLLCVLVLAGAGVGLGLHRAPIYTATSQVVVEPLAPTIVQLSGAVQAAEDLATNESRLIDSDAITTPLAQEFHTTGHHIANHLLATPVPNSTVVKITAESESESGAVELANAAAEHFSAYVTATLQNSTIANRVLKAYSAAVIAYRRTLNASAKAPTKQAKLEASAAVAAAQLRQQALSQQYENLVQSHSTAPTVATFVLADTAISDRTSKLEIYVFAGVLVGLLIGCALVTLLANRRSRRDLLD